MRAVRRLWVAFLFIGLALGMVPAAARGGQELMPRSVDPYLWRMTREKGTTKIPVIIQLRGPVADPTALLTKSGGRMNEKVRLVNSLRAELPAAAVAVLARSAQVQYISVDSPLKLTAIDLASLQTIYNQVVGSPSLWNSSGLTGQGVGVAVLDTGATPHDDLRDHLTAINTNVRALSSDDGSGHGTHVAGIIAGRSSSGRYYGVAPDAQIISVKVADDAGNSTEGDLLRGMQWIYDHRSMYNIRVVNISLTGTVPTSYLTSPLNAGVEQLWRAGIFVVVAAGNRGDQAGAVHFPPANDGFALTVGALDDSGTIDAADDVLGTFSSRGITQDNLVKPEIVAPGRKIISTLASKQAALPIRLPARVVEDKYLRLTGTSMAAPVIAGAAALILQRHPNLTPDQLKWVMTESARSYPGRPAGTAPALDLQAALTLAGSGPPRSSNQGLVWNTNVNPTLDTVTWNSSYWESSYWESTYAEPVSYDALD